MMEHLPIMHSPQRVDGLDGIIKMRARKQSLLDDSVDHSNTADSVDLASLLEQLDIVNSKLGDERLQAITIHPILHDYLKSNKDYLRATIERNKGWANEEADKHFSILQESADNVTTVVQRKFHEQMNFIGQDMDRLYNLSIDLEASGDAKFLDLCMSPGGFSGTILANAPNSQAYGVSLPVEKGGHPLCIDERYATRIQVHWMDITMLSAEMGVTDIPADHPDISQFSTLRPYEGFEFGLVFCDGNVLRIHKRAEYREIKEGIRLLMSQLVLAFQRIKNGGTLVCRFHKIKRLETAKLLHLFSKMSMISVYKPISIHGARSSFYMVAKDIQIHSPVATQAVEEWKRQWREATLDIHSSQQKAMLDHNDPERIRTAQDVVENFGSRLIQLAEPIWKIQTDALLNKPFNTGRPYRFENEKFNPKPRYTPNSRGTTGDFRNKLDWRPRNPDPENAQPISTEKTDHYVAPQRRRSSFLGKDSDVSHDSVSGDGTSAPPPRHLWGSKPHMTTAMDTNSWRSRGSDDTQASTPTLDRPVFATHRVHAYGIGKPGGNFSSNANAMSSTADHGSAKSWRRKQDRAPLDDDQLGESN